MKGKSVVNIKIGKLFNQSLPSITLCPGILSIEKLSVLHHKYKEFYKQYQTMIKNKTKFMEASTFYYTWITNVLVDMKSGELSIDIYDLMKNYSYEYLNDEMEPQIDVRITKRTVDYSEYEPSISKMPLPPIESISVNWMLTKCFTFFSHLQRDWRLSTIEFDSIVITIKNFDAMHHDYNYPFPLIMHSPNDLPALENGKYKMFELNTFYHVQYSEYQIRRLGHGYDTDCKDYDHDTIRSDCLVSCYQKLHDQLCNGTGLAQSPTLIRESILVKKSNRKLDKCEAYKMSFKKMMSECSSQCQKECDFKYYSYTITRLENSEDTQTRIHILHNDMPDIFIQYIPEITFTSFACNFGGLLGMWLGVSFLSIVGHFKSLIFKFINKHTKKLSCNFLPSK